MASVDTEFEGRLQGLGGLAEMTHVSKLTASEAPKQ
jgi:hypothetical protein